MIYHVRYTTERESQTWCDVEAGSPAEALDVAKETWGKPFAGSDGEWCYYQAYPHAPGHSCADEVEDWSYGDDPTKVRPAGSRPRFLA